MTAIIRRGMPTTIRVNKHYCDKPGKVRRWWNRLTEGSIVLCCGCGQHWRLEWVDGWMDVGSFQWVKCADPTTINYVEYSK